MPVSRLCGVLAGCSDCEVCGVCVCLDGIVTLCWQLMVLCLAIVRCVWQRSLNVAVSSPAPNTDGKEHVWLTKWIVTTDSGWVCLLSGTVGISDFCGGIYWWVVLCNWLLVGRCVVRMGYTMWYLWGTLCSVSVGVFGTLYSVCVSTYGTRYT